MHGAWNMIGRITHQITHLLRRTIHPCPVPFCSVVACLLCLPFVQLRTVQILQNEDRADDIFDTSFTVFQLQSLRFFPTTNESTCNISKEQRPMVLMSMQQFLQVDDLVSQDAAMLRSRAEILRYNAMVQMLVERTVLADLQSNQSDRSLEVYGNVALSDSFGGLASVAVKRHIFNILKSLPC